MRRDVCEIIKVKDLKYKELKEFMTVRKEEKVIGLDC